MKMKNQISWKADFVIMRRDVLTTPLGMPLAKVVLEKVRFHPG
jgi:hypothetical protein